MPWFYPVQHYSRAVQTEKQKKQLLKKKKKNSCVHTTNSVVLKTNNTTTCRKSWVYYIVQWGVEKDEPTHWWWLLLAPAHILSSDCLVAERLSSHGDDDILAFTAKWYLKINLCKCSLHILQFSNGFLPRYSNSEHNDSKNHICRVIVYNLMYLS